MRPISMIALALLASWLGMTTAGRAAEPGRAAEARRPNVVLIVADCLGFSDLGCYGSEIPTPHIDALAREGIRLTRSHTPSAFWFGQVEAMTGMDGARLGGNDKRNDALARHLQQMPFLTLGEILRDAGYENLTVSSLPLFPAERYGVQPTGNAKSPYNVGGNYQRISDFLTKRKADSPFFVYWSPHYPMYPLMASAKKAAGLRAAYEVGPEKIAQQRYERQVRLKLVDPALPWTNPVSELLKATPALASYRTNLVNTDEPLVRKGQHIVGKDSESLAEIMSYYAATITTLDDQVGVIVTRLRETKELDRTLIILTSSCGSDGNKASTGPDGVVDPTGIYGPLWANCSSTPYHGYRWTPYAGGRIVPVVLSYSRGTTPQAKGSIQHVFSSGRDLVPTVLEAAGVPHAASDAKGRKLLALEGRSLAGLLQGNQVGPAQTYYTDSFGHTRMLMNDEWTLTWGRQGTWELYHAGTDPFERRNLASKHPETVEKLSKQWEAWAVEVKAKNAPRASKP